MEYYLNFNLVWRHSARLWWGLALSIELAAISILIGCVIGFALAVVYGGKSVILRKLVTAYVEFVRNVPLLLLIYLVFYGIPSAGGFAYGATESFVATLSLYAGAYLVEVFRAGLDAVPKGARDAAKAIGLTPWGQLAHVRFPIMLRIVLPSLSNAFISLFKDTSLASVIAVPELTYGANWIKTNTFRAVEVWMIVGPLYLVTGYVILVALRGLEQLLIRDRRR
ncbi:amino acid ABC transporter permease [Terrarubrum flagellatum]|uniref:amino acid ABC transporter permease n=1 Tax=Terrirubrum flagellatum TaxID=2895980 RepID=UPI0031452939